LRRKNEENYSILFAFSACQAMRPHIGDGFNARTQNAEMLTSYRRDTSVRDGRLLQHEKAGDFKEP
jgi:hypothetical protein